MATQLARNCIHYEHAGGPQKPGCPNGIVALTGRATDSGLNDTAPTHGSDYQVWEMPPANHATLGIHLGMPVAEMLAVHEPSVTSYSRRINDQWNVAGLKDTAGYPTATSH